MEMLNNNKMDILKIKELNLIFHIHRQEVLIIFDLKVIYLYLEFFKHGKVAT